MAKYPAAFINAIAEEGNKAEAVEWLQRTWDDYMELRLFLIKLGFSSSEIQEVIDGT
jgi:hypothetical protein